MQSFNLKDNIEGARKSVIQLPSNIRGAHEICMTDRAQFGCCFVLRLIRVIQRGSRNKCTSF